MRAALVVFVAAVAALLLWPYDDACDRAGMDRAGAPAGAPPREVPPAVAEEPAGEPRKPEVTETPPDTIETGSCSLFVRLEDWRTGEPRKSKVSLWRLDAPANENWSAGDQRQATGDVPVDGRVFENLPEGEYRLFVYAESFMGDPAPAFHVAGPRTNVAIPIFTPDKFRAHLKVYTETGAMVDRAETRRYSQSRITRASVPDWANERVALRGGGTTIGIGGGAGGGMRVRKRVHAGPLGFDLGEIEQDDREWAVHRNWIVKPRDRSRVRVSVSQAITKNRTYFGLSVPRKTLHDLVYLPNNMRAIDAGAFFYMTCAAVLEEPDTPVDAWRALPITVKVTLKGYEPLEFQYRLDDVPAARYLVPAP